MSEELSGNASMEGAVAPDPGFSAERIRPTGAEPVYDSGDPASMAEALETIVRKRADRLPAQIEDAVETANRSIGWEDPTVAKLTWLDGKPADHPRKLRESANALTTYHLQKAAAA